MVYVMFRFIIATDKENDMQQHCTGTPHGLLRQYLMRSVDLLETIGVDSRSKLHQRWKCLWEKRDLEEGEVSGLKAELQALQDRITENKSRISSKVRDSSFVQQSLVWIQKAIQSN